MIYQRTQITKAGTLFGSNRSFCFVDELGVGWVTEREQKESSTQAKQCERPLLIYQMATFTRAEALFGQTDFG